MNDEEFRKNCKAFANDVIGFYSDWRKSLTEPESWLNTMEDTNQLATAALLYIAANMPSLDESDEKPCEICGGSQTIDCTGNGIHYFYIDNKQNQLVEVHGDSETHISIKYCPFCKREL